MVCPRKWGEGAWKTLGNWHLSLLPGRGFWLYNTYLFALIIKVCMEILHLVRTQERWIWHLHAQKCWSPWRLPLPPYRGKPLTGALVLVNHIRGIEWSHEFRKSSACKISLVLELLAIQSHGSELNGHYLQKIAHCSHTSKHSYRPFWYP